MQNRLVERIPAINSIHHVHVWGLTPQHLMLTMHVALKDNPPDATAVVRRVKGILREDFGIRHSTIEIETDDCADH
jgi:cobalt-zinc-cadmium efflux system protein